MLRRAHCGRQGQCTFALYETAVSVVAMFVVAASIVAVSVVVMSMVAASVVVMSVVALWEVALCRVDWSLLDGEDQLGIMMYLKSVVL